MGVRAHGGDTTKLDNLQKIDTWEVEQFAYLLLGNLFHSMLLATGVPSTSFGDSTGVLAQVKV